VFLSVWARVWGRQKGIHIQAIHIILCATWLIICDSLRYVTWFMTHDSSIHVTRLMSFLNYRKIKVRHLWHATGWRRLIGCLKLQVIFRKRATNYKFLLRKMTYKDKASCDSTPPCRKEGKKATGWRTIIRCHILIGHFLQKGPKISGFVAEKDLQLEGSCASSAL